ncbi:MAG: type II secretion system protein [Brachyspira sp.]|nr:type II secretion system protein [Brachyspira sp.]
MKITLKRYGFTLAEMMVCLAVLSIIATMLIPAIMQVKPAKNKILFKKAYYLAERIVTELVNDEDMYATKLGKEGFDEIEPAAIDSSISGNTKFCKLFATKVNTVDDVPNCVSNQIAFISSDGIEWIMPITDFTTDAKIKVDVNGSDKKPNCMYNKTDPEKCSDPDIFEIFIKKDGKMYVKDEKAKEYLKTNDTIKR